MTGHKPNDWNKWPSLAEFWYNNNYHSSLKMAHFKVLYGYEPPQLSFELIAQSSVDVVDQYYRERQIMAKVLKENLAKAQNRMKMYADKKRTEREFEVGDWVFLKLQPYRQTSIAVRRSLKLASKFYGPYQVIQKIGPVAYKLALPSTAKIHPVFHISQLKKKVGKHVVPATDPLICSSGGQPLVEPVAILDRRMVKKGNIASTQILVQWANLLPEEATWEDYQFIRSQFPEFEDS